MTERPVEYAANAYNRIYVHRPQHGRTVRSDEVEVVEVPNDARLRVRHSPRSLHVWIESMDDPEVFDFEIVLKHPVLSVLDESEIRFEGFESDLRRGVSPNAVEVGLARVSIGPSTPEQS